MKMTILRNVSFKFQYLHLKIFVFQKWTVIIRDSILWSFYIQNIDFILFLTSNLDLLNVISILQRFDSKLFGFISFLSWRTKIEYKSRTETCNDIILTYLEMIPFCTFCIKLHHFYIIIPDSNGNIFKNLIQ